MHVFPLCKTPTQISLLVFGTFQTILADFSNFMKLNKSAFMMTKLCQIVIHDNYENQVVIS